MKFYVIEGEVSILNLDFSGKKTIGKGDSYQIPRGAIIDLKPETVILVHAVSDVLLNRLVYWYSNVFKLYDLVPSLMQLANSLKLIAPTIPGDFVAMITNMRQNQFANNW